MFTPDNLGTMIDYAVKHALTHKGCDVESVVNCAIELLPYLHDRTLLVLDVNIGQYVAGGLPNYGLDSELWEQLCKAIRKEGNGRGLLF